jgi:hypothetical protein
VLHQHTFSFQSSFFIDHLFDSNNHRIQGPATIKQQYEALSADFSIFHLQRQNHVPNHSTKEAVAKKTAGWKEVHGFFGLFLILSPIWMLVQSLWEGICCAPITL